MRLRHFLPAAALLLALAGPAEARCSARTPAARAAAIARHAWDKHGPEFGPGRRIANKSFPRPGLTSEGELAAKVKSILDGGAGEQISNGRTKFWEDATGTIVIFNSRARDCGTAFRPNQGRRYYDRQR